MKRSILMTALLFSIVLQAQQGPRHEKGRDGGQKVIMEDFSPEEVATLKTKKMTLGLDLSQAQQDKIYKIHLQTALDKQVRMAELKKKREAGEWVRPSKEERFNHINSRLDKQIAHKKEMKTILNKDQFEKWERNAGKRGHMKNKNRIKRSTRSRR